MTNLPKPPNCLLCEYRRPIPGDTHSKCEHPLVKNPDKWDKLAVKGERHAIVGGWFTWPWNFDPIWLRACRGFIAKS